MSERTDIINKLEQKISDWYNWVYSDEPIITIDEAKIIVKLLKEINMKPKDAKYVRETIENEGFGYAFLDYSDFEDIKDEKFHELRKAFIKAQQELDDYIGFKDED